MLKLIDLIMVCNDSMEIYVYDNDCDLIAQYDGRNAIPIELNNQYIEWIFPIAQNVLNVGLA